MTVIVAHDGFLGGRLTAALAGREALTTVGRRTGDVAADLRREADLDAVCRLAAGRVVYYCANVGGRAAAAADPTGAHLVNTVAPARLAAAASRLVYFSTDYVFSTPGPATADTPVSPRGVYATTKAGGERAVLAASPTAQVIRVSGLYDHAGTQAHTFATLRRVAAADNRTSNPTYLPDLLAAVLDPPADGGRIRHVVGPDALSSYEFLQLASLAAGFDVTPTLDVEPRRTVLVPSPGAGVRRPAEVFTAARADTHDQPFRSVLVLDCVGVVLSGRRWRHPDPAFWTGLEAGPDAPLRQHGADTIVAAYGPNPAGWALLRRRPHHQRIILANNGPWATFGRWHDRYGFAHLFHTVINSQRDGIAKPDAAFRRLITERAGGRPITLVDDRADIIRTARTWGWTGVASHRVGAWPVERFAPERM